MLRHFKFDPVLKNDESFYWEAESMCVYAIHNNLSNINSLDELDYESMCVYAIHNNLSNINSLDELDIHAFYLFMFICVFFFLLQNWHLNQKTILSSTLMTISRF